MTRDQASHFVVTSALADEQNGAVRGARSKFHLHVERGARIESRAKTRRKFRRQQPGRRRERAVPADECAAVASRGSQRIAHVRERDPPRELRVPRIGCEDRTGGLVAARDDVHALILPRRPEHPVVVRNETETPDRGRPVHHASAPRTSRRPPRRRTPRGPGQFRDARGRIASLPRHDESRSGRSTDPASWDRASATTPPPSRRRARTTLRQWDP